MNATTWPSPDIAGSATIPPRGVWSPPTNGIRVVVPLVRSWRKTSGVTFVSPSTRSGAPETNATNRPFEATTGLTLGPWASTPPLRTDERVVVPSGSPGAAGLAAAGRAGGRIAAGGAAGAPACASRRGAAGVAAEPAAGPPTAATHRPTARTARTPRRVRAAGCRGTGPRDCMCRNCTRRARA